MLHVTKQPKNGSIESAWTLACAQRVKKIYDEPKIPFHRLIECDALTPADKWKLKAMCARTSLSKPKAELDRRMAALKPRRTLTDSYS